MESILYNIILSRIMTPRMIEAQQLYKIFHACCAGVFKQILAGQNLLQSFPSGSAQVQLSGGLTFAPLAQLHTLAAAPWEPTVSCVAVLDVQKTHWIAAVPCRLGVNTSVLTF